MNKRQFVQAREPAWRQFERLVRRLGSVKLKQMSSRDVNEFSRLFREMSNDLATVRSREWGAELETYLNHLVSRGHNSFYTEKPGQFLSIFVFLTVGFPKLLRENIGYFATACLLFFGTMAASWIAVQNDPSLATHVLEQARIDGIEQSFGKREGSAGGRNLSASKEAQTKMAGFYVQHNVGIAFKCFGSGILLGIPTVYTLLFNGISLGATSGYVIATGDRNAFLSFVITHGSFELTAIAVAGAGGLMLGNAILHRGSRTLLDSLRTRGLDAVKIGFGAGVMLVIAAAIEGFWSQSAVPMAMKYSVGTVMWVVVILYLTLAGRGT